METSSSYDREYWVKIHDALLNDWDPIGIAEYPQAQDEYDAYVPEVFNLLKGNPTLDEIFTYLWELETGHMALSDSQLRRERTKKFAHHLLGISHEMRGLK